MCGFTCIYNFDGREVDPRELSRMTDVIAHRGPDGAGIWTNGGVGFGFRRLAIQDLSPAGDQPMTSDDGRYTVVFNGEIYNFVELRQRLTKLGHRFRSAGDTEVLLHAFRQWGWECLPMLNGMWAFLIHDRDTGIVHGSRDRFGIKPLFHGARAGQHLFASEIKSIRAHSPESWDVDWGVAAEFLINRRLDYCSRSFTAGVSKVEPGSAFEVRPDGQIKTWKFWTLPDQDSAFDAHADEEFAEVFADSVRLRLRSDVPLGVFLSGGLDSTSIICEMDRQNREAHVSTEISAFSFMHEEFDESPFIADTLAQVGANLHRTTTDARHLWDNLAGALWYHDEPVHSMTALIGFELAKIARASGIKVVLNGQGADEAAAGYTDYFENYWHSLLAKGRPLRCWSEIGAHVAAFDGSQFEMFRQTAARLVRAQFRRVPPYRRIAGRRKWRVGRSHPWFHEDLREHLEPREAPFLDLNLDHRLRESVTDDPLPLYLRIEDRNSMAHGVEARLPFLDYRLVSLLFKNCDQWKMQGPWNKYIVRSAMKGRIPESTRLRKEKMGFPVPVGGWIAGPLFSLASDVLHDSTTRQRGLYDVERILADLVAHRDGKIDVSNEIFDVLQFEVWLAGMDEGVAKTE